MKILLRIVGTLVFLVGVVWTLQGSNILLGSPMSGQTKWQINGIIAVVIGAGLVAGSFALKKRT